MSRILCVGSLLMRRIQEAIKSGFLDLNDLASLAKERISLRDGSSRLPLVSRATLP